MQINIKKKGFTLIELLVVIAIIGILASIVLTSLRSAKLKSQDANFKTIASSINTAAQMCCQDGGTLQSKDLADTVGVAICQNTDITNATYPGDADINTVQITTACSNGEYIIEMTPGTTNSGNCTLGTFSAAGLISFTGCE